MITKYEINYILTGIGEPDPSDIANVAVSVGKNNGGGSNFKITRTVEYFLDMKHKPYQKHHNSTIGRSQYLLVLAREFAEREKGVMAQENVNHTRFHDDILYALQILKKIFCGYVDVKRFRTQSDTVSALLLWNTARQYEIKNDMPTTGYLDRLVEEDDEPEPTPIAAPLQAPTLLSVDGEDIFTLSLPTIQVTDDLFEYDEVEDLQDVHVPIATDADVYNPPTRQLLTDADVYEAYSGQTIHSEKHKPFVRKTGLQSKTNTGYNLRSQK